MLCQVFESLEKTTRNLGFSESIRVDEASSIAFGAMDGLLGVCWDDDITSDEMDHSRKFPT